MVISDKFGNGGHVMKIPTAMDDSSVGLQKPEVGRQPNLDIQPALNIKRSDEQSQPVQYSIPGILHFIQHEWARFELERSQWEVDRAEFEARIAFLQGERKGQENLKNDLVRRIKMLEYALKQERAKFHNLKYGVDLQQGEVKPPAEEAMTDQDIEAKMPWKQGRQLIRQYLREIGYADTILDVRSSRVQALLGLNNNSDQDDINLSLNGTDPVVKHSNVPRGFTVDKWRLKNSNWKEEGESGGDALLDGEAAVFANFEFLASQDVDMDVLDDLDAKQASAVANSQSDEDVDHAAKEVLNELNLYTEGDSDIGGQGDDYPGGGGGAGEEPLALGLGELAQLSVSNEAEAYDASQPQNTKDSFRKTWNAKYTLRSHFDGVRALAFHPTEPELVTASEDHTLKLWNLQRTVPAKKTAGLDVEPLYTFRGHRGPALCLAVDGGGGRCWSGGLDGAVRAWRLPRPGADPYDAFEPDALGPPLAGHADAVWSLARRGARLLSASADGALRLWAPDAAEPLLATLRSEADGAPACADFAEEGRAVACYAELAALAFDLETGAAVLRFGEGEASPAARVAAHPSAPLVVTAHEDRRVRFWDARSGRLAHSMVAHLDAVTSLAVDPNGLFLLSGSHDCSIRLWNLDTKTCVQEITAHRKKFDESILDVAFHPSRPYIASAGADSLAKVFV